MEEEKKPKFSIPYAMAIEGETSVRDQAEGWKFRVLTNTIRQTPTQIKKVEERYSDTVTSDNR